MSFSNNYPTVGPVLNLDFINNEALDPRVTFTRASTATYYNGVTTAVAEQNLLTYSQQLDDGTNWPGLRVSRTANATTAPDGTSTADSIVQAAGQTTYGRIYQNYSVSTAKSYVFSVFAKPNGKNFVVLSTDRFIGTDFDSTWFNVSTGAVGTTDPAHTATITSAGGGWYRCSVAITTSSPTAPPAASIGIADTDGSTTVADDGNGLYLWGAQLEQRSSVTAYTATTTQPITNYVPVLLTAQNNVPRFDHNPTTGVARGLLIEEQRTNSFLQSESFGDVYWVKANGAVTDNAVVAPDGTLTADYFYGSGSGAHYLYRGVTLTQNQPYTMSCFVKQGNLAAPEVRLRDFTEAGSVTFNIVTGTISVAATGICSNASIVSVGNGWFRISAVFTPTIATGNHNLSPVHLSSSNVTTGFYCWGAQLEAGAFATSYIPTTTTALTRNADVASMTGTNFSSWFNAAAGSLLVQGTKIYSGSSAFPRLIQIGDATNNNAMGILWSDSLSRLYAAVTTSGVTQADIGNNGLTQTANHKSAFAYQVNDFAISNDGLAAQTDAAGTIPSVDRMFIGKDAGASYYNGHIQRIAYYNYRVSNAQLQALTGA